MSEELSRRMLRDSPDEPYMLVEITFLIRRYNPEFGDERLCQCGHPYHRHFDDFEDEDEQDVGCKYCRCSTFTENKTTEETA